VLSTGYGKSPLLEFNHPNHKLNMRMRPTSLTLTAIPTKFRRSCEAYQLLALAYIITTYNFHLFVLVRSYNWRVQGLVFKVLIPVSMN